MSQGIDDGDIGLYAVLGVSTDATAEQIRRAYRLLATACHPDKHPGEDEESVEMRREAAAHFNRVQEAYEILGDKDKREVYDVYASLINCILINHTHHVNVHAMLFLCVSVPSFSYCFHREGEGKLRRGHWWDQKWSKGKVIRAGFSIVDRMPTKTY